MLSIRFLRCHVLLWFCRGRLSTLQWRHNCRDGVSNHQPRDYLLNRLFRSRSKKTPKLRWPVNSPHKGPVTRKMFPFDDDIMGYILDVLPDGTIVVPVMWPWRIWLNESHRPTWEWLRTKTKQCEYFMGYNVLFYIETERSSYGLLTTTVRIVIRRFIWNTIQWDLNQNTI